MKTNTVYFSAFVIFLTIFISCTENDNINDFLEEQNFHEKTELKYAEKFTIDRYEDFDLLFIKSIHGDEEGGKYLLSDNEALINSLRKKYKWNNTVIIKTPAEKVVSLSSQNIAFLDALSLLEEVKGIDLRRNISNSKIHKMVSDRKIYELGEGRDIDLETLLLISPDLVLMSGTGGDYDPGSLLNGQNAVLTYEWLEKTPLARAEWIKCIALFFGETEKAETLFNEIEANYLNLKKAASGSESRLSVLSNMVYGDSWAVPGGRSFAANLFNDANIVYPWSNDNSEGSLFLDFETVLASASEADIWLLNSIGIDTIEDVLKADRRYEMFSPVIDGNVYNNDLGKSGYGNPYWEEGILYPDRILSDLIKIFHPEIENENPFYFYKKLPLK